MLFLQLEAMFLDQWTNLEGRLVSSLAAPLDFAAALLGAMRARPFPSGYGFAFVFHVFLLGPPRWAPDGAVLDAPRA